MKAAIRNAIHAFWVCPLIGWWIGSNQDDPLGMAIVWTIFVAPTVFGLILFANWLYSD